MTAKIYIDANVLLDTVLNRAGEPYAELIFEQMEQAKIAVHISPIFLHLVYYVACKYREPAKVRTLFIAFLNHAKIIEASQDTVLKALHSPISDVEDAIQYHTAIQHHLDYFISSDKKLMKSALSILPVLTPEAFLRLKNP